MGSGGLIGLLFLFLSLLAAVIEWLRRETRPPITRARADSPSQPKRSVR